MSKYNLNSLLLKFSNNYEFNQFNYLFMQSRSSAVCSNDHNAQKVCVQIGCAKSAVMCFDSQCQYSFQKHQMCQNQLDIDQLHEIMLKNTQPFEVINLKISNFLDSLIKEIQIVKQDFIRSLEAPENRLDDLLRGLFTLVMKGPNNFITPAMVEELVRFLKFPNGPSKKQIEKIDSLIASKTEQIRNHLAQVKELWKYQVNYTFEKTMRHKNIELKKDGKQAQVISADYFDEFVLMDPRLVFNRFDTTKAQLKILDSKQQIFVGAANKQKIEARQYEWGSGQGLYLIKGANGQIHNKFNSAENKSISELRFTTGDVLHLKFDYSLRILTIENKTDQTKGKINEINQQDLKQLCFCVKLSQQGEKVQIIGGPKRFGEK